MRLKKFVALAMTAVMAVSVMAACSSPAETSKDAAAQVESGDKGKAAGGEKTVINVWSKDRHDADYVQNKIDEYNKTNTDNIEVVYTLYTDILVYV